MLAKLLAVTFICVATSYLHVLCLKNRILFTVGNVDRDIGRYSGRYSGRHSVDSRSTLG